MKDYKTDLHQILIKRRNGKIAAKKAPAALLITIYFVTYTIMVS